MWLLIRRYKALAHPINFRLIEVARYKLVKAWKECGLSFKKILAKEAKHLKRKARSYAHEKQFKMLKKVIKRQRTIVGFLLKETGTNWQM